MNLLDKIFDEKRKDVCVRKSRNLADAKSKALDMPGTRGFLNALTESDKNPSLIAEVKKASPAKGLIREDFEPVSIALEYERVGASCLSVLTDVAFFQGSPEYLRQVRESVRIPILRKDFTVDELDVYEARCMGADAVLLIANGLSDCELSEFSEIAESLGMDVLFEAHSFDEAERVLRVGAKLLGINNRNLETFETDIDMSMNLIPQFRDRAICVSESALSSFEDISKVKDVGARSVLIGTAFCRKPDIGLAVKEVMGW